MNVYDFDETILDGDSEVLFFKYVMKHRKLKISTKNKYLFYTFLEVSKISKYPKVRNKRYVILDEIKNDLSTILSDFWSINKNKIKQWYLDQKKDDDIITSATPRFILEPIMKELGIKNLIATEYNSETNVWDFNYGENKVKHLLKLYPNIEIDNFYSDSLKDLPLAKLAKNAYRVCGNELITPFDSSTKK